MPVYCVPVGTQLTFSPSPAQRWVSSSRTRPSETTDIFINIHSINQLKKYIYTVLAQRWEGLQNADTVFTFNRIPVQIRFRKTIKLKKNYLQLIFQNLKHYQYVPVIGKLKKPPL